MTEIAAGKEMIEIAEALGIPTEGCVGFEIHAYAGDPIMVAASYVVRVANVGRFKEVVKKFELKEKK